MYWTFGTVDALNAESLPVRALNMPMTQLKLR